LALEISPHLDEVPHLSMLLTIDGKVYSKPTPTTLSGFSNGKTHRHSFYATNLFVISIFVREFHPFQFSTSKLSA